MVIENTKSSPEIFMTTEKEKCSKVTFVRFYRYTENTSI
jgi:hypothetical protein